MGFAVFLAIDGGLNTRTTVEGSPNGIEKAEYASKTPAIEAMLFLEAIQNEN